MAASTTLLVGSLTNNDCGNPCISGVAFYYVRGELYEAFFIHSLCRDMHDMLCYGKYTELR